MPVTLKIASISDAEELWRMQTTAFAELLEKYQDYDTNPACETLDRVREKIGGRYYYFICHDGINVGAICVFDQKDGSQKRITPIFIMPEHRNCGFAQQAIKLCESIHGEENWHLDTILQETGNCHLYEKMGYQKTGNTRIVNDRMTLVDYEK